MHAKRQVLGGSKTQRERRPDMANLKIPGSPESDKNKNKQYDKSPLPIDYRRLVKTVEGGTTEGMGGSTGSISIP